jgi:AcrR family transcriptional regulator
MATAVRKRRRIDIARIRREEIVEAAVAVIAAQGLQGLSLSEIEKRAGMSRGQLTYYFKTKEEILLAVFDRLLARMCVEAGTDPDNPRSWMPGWEHMIRAILTNILEGSAPHPEFHCLQFTFLAQIGHRGDFRRRLASLYEEWRGHLAEQLARELRRRPPVRRVSARNLATLIQGIFHGLAVQAAADPEAFDHKAMVRLCLDVVGSYLGGGAARDGRRPR